MAGVYDKVRDLLTSRELDLTVSDDGFQIRWDSAAVNIDIVEQEGRTLVQCYAPVLRELSASSELFEYVATEGQDYYFGSMQYVPDVDGGLLVLEHTLLGDFLDADELDNVVDSLVIVANRLDDELQERFGGKRFVD
jgi:hypothetical protein